MFLYQGLLAFVSLLRGNILLQHQILKGQSVSPARNNWAILWAMISIPLKQNIAILELTD